MTSHEFADYLKQLPDLPLVMEGYIPDENFTCIIAGASRVECSKEFLWRNDEEAFDGEALIIGYYDEDGKWALRFPKLETTSTNKQ